MTSPTRRNLSWERFLDCKNWILDPQDTISRLPDGVKHHIISFLPDEDRYQLRLLSRNWRLYCSRSRTKLKLEKLRLDEQQFLTILQDYFPSAKIFSLAKCSGIENLNLASHSLREIKLYKCANVEKVTLTAPNLVSFNFIGFLRKPCIVELGITSNLKTLQLVGAHIDETMFSQCDTIFPVLWWLSIDGSHYMSDKITISSRSLKTLKISGFKKLVDITIDVPQLDFIGYEGRVMAKWSNLNIPNVKNARIELKPNARREPDGLWFQKMVDMIQGFNPAEMLVLVSNSDKNIIIPEELRSSIVPPLIAPKAVVAELDKPANYNVDLIDVMLWFSPRAEYLHIMWKRYRKSVWLVHGEIVGGLMHSCCASYPVRCWRHSVKECIVDVGNYDNWDLNLANYFTENIESVGRRASEEEVVVRFLI